MSRELLAGTTRSQRFSFGQKMDGQPERWGETWGGYGGDEGRGKRMFEKEASKRLRKHGALGSRMALERASVWAGLDGPDSAAIWHDATKTPSAVAGIRCSQINKEGLYKFLYIYV